MADGIGELADTSVVAVDVGSTTARAGVFDPRGQLLARAVAPFATHRPAPLHAEHSSDDIWQAVCAAVHEAVATAGIDPQTIRGLAFDATCSLALFDREGRPATVSTTGEDRWNVVMWADHRAIAEAEEITASRHRVLDFVGGTMSPEMEVPKLLWLKRHLPQAWKRYHLALDLADFLAWRCTGEIAVSACTVTCKWTYLAHENPGWQTDFFDAIGLGEMPGKLRFPPRAKPIGSAAGTLLPQIAGELGLTPACIVGIGAIDAHAGGIGTLAGIDPVQRDRRLAMIAGTSTCHMAVSPRPRAVPGVWGPYYGAMFPDLWLNEAGQAATGGLLEHVLDWHAEGRSLGADRHERVDNRIGELLDEHGPQFVGDMQVVPDFHGNRSPLADPESRGMILGLTLDSSFDSLARLYFAAAVGIALGTRHILDSLNAHGYAIDTIHVTGGHTASPMLVRLYADATGCPVILPKEQDGVLLGSACVAATAAGLYRDLMEAGRAMVRAGNVVIPDPRTAGFYDRRYRTLRFLLEQRRNLSAGAFALTEDT